MTQRYLILLESGAYHEYHGPYLDDEKGRLDLVCDGHRLAHNWMDPEEDAILVLTVKDDGIEIHDFEPAHEDHLLWKAPTPPVAIPRQI